MVKLWKSSSCFGRFLADHQKVIGGILLVMLIIAALIIGFPMLIEGREDIGERHAIPSRVLPAMLAADCGASSLYAVCKLDGKNFSLPYLRELTKTTVLGNSMYDLKQAAESILFLEKGHFVVAMEGRKKDAVRILDVLDGIKDLNESELENRLNWKGKALLLFGGQG